jgi:hypothetical protein
MPKGITFALDNTKIQKFIFLMKRQILFAAGILMTGSMLFVASCSKNDGDSTAPVVTVLGSDEEVILNSGTWTDPGATATDDEDGSVAVTSDASSTNPNANHTGTYTITYTATDAAGNVGTASRTVRVYNEAENYAGTYNVIDTCGTSEVFNYAQTITVDETINNRVMFSKFANYLNNSNIYAIKVADGTLFMPSQPAIGIGSGSDSCSVADHSFSSIVNSSWLVNDHTFTLRYNDQKTNPANCISSATCIAYYMK